MFMKAKFVFESLDERKFQPITLSDIEYALDKLSRETNVKVKDIKYTSALRRTSPNSIPGDEQTIVVSIFYEASQDFGGSPGYGTKSNTLNIRCFRSEEDKLINYLEQKLNEMGYL